MCYSLHMLEAYTPIPTNMYCAIRTNVPAHTSNRTNTTTRLVLRVNILYLLVSFMVNVLRLLERERKTKITSNRLCFTEPRKKRNNEKKQQQQFQTFHTYIHIIDAHKRHIYVIGCTKNRTKSKNNTYFGCEL